MRTIFDPTAQLTCLFVRMCSYSLYNVCVSLGVEWGLQGDTAVWPDKVPGSQSQTGPTGNEKALLSPLCHFAIPEKRREAWQKRRWRRAAQNGPGTGGSTCHCSCRKEKDVGSHDQRIWKYKNQPKIFQLFSHFVLLLISYNNYNYILHIFLNLFSITKEIKSVH